VAGASVATGAEVGATPQAVATVPTIVMADTFKKSRRLIFLLCISASFSLGTQIELYLAKIARHLSDY